MVDVYRIVKYYLDQADFEDLLAMHCPPDEYAPEAQRISAAISETDTPEAIAAVIAKIWNQTFGTVPPAERCLDTARKIFSEIALQDVEESR